MKSITQVMQNLVKPYIDNKDKAYAANIAPVEVSPAEAAHTAGTQLIYNGVLYDVTADIAIGDIVTTEGAGANISAADTVTEQLATISSVNETYAANIAPVEVSPAEAAHTAGTQLIYNGVLYDVTADIAINDNLATEGAGANISAADKVTEQLATISGNLTTETTNRQNADANISDVIGKNGAKNLLEIKATTQTDPTGLQWTVTDGIVTANGTATGDNARLIVNNTLALEVGVTYKISGCPSVTGCFLRVYNGSGTTIAEDTGSGAQFTVDVLPLTVRCIVTSGATVSSSDVIFKPMITLASQPDSDYAHHEPYSKTNQQLTDGLDGTIETVALNGAHNLFDIEKWLKAGNATYTKSGNSYTITVLSSLYTPMVLFDTAQDVIVHGSLTAVGSTTGRIELLDSADAVLVQLNQSTSFPVKVNGVSKIRFNWGTAPTSFTISDFMICLQTDKSSTYAPYTKTNRELTEDLAGTNLLAEIKQLTVTFEASDTIGTQLGRLYTAFTNYCATLDDNDFIIPWALTIAGYEPLIYQGSGMYTKASSAINALFISFALGASNMNIYRACVRSASPYMQNFTQSGSTSSLTALTDDARTSGQNMSLLVYRYKKV